MFSCSPIWLIVACRISLLSLSRWLRGFSSDSRKQSHPSVLSTFYLCSHRKCNARRFTIVLWSRHECIFIETSYHTSLNRSICTGTKLLRRARICSVNFDAHQFLMLFLQCSSCNLVPISQRDPIEIRISSWTVAAIAYITYNRRCECFTFISNREH